MEIVLLLIGLGVGFAVGFLLAKSKKQDVSANDDSAEQLQLQLLNNAKLEEAEIHLTKERDQLKSELEEVRQKFHEADNNLTASRTHFKDQEQRIADQKKEFEELNKRFNTEFQNLANKILEEKSEKFTERNKENLEAILKPLRERIKDFEEKVERSYSEEKKDKAELRGEIKQLMKLNQQISLEANNLASALKGDSKKQGNWGELMLERILESSGLIKDEEYRTQYHTQNEDGRRIHPDVVIMLPDSKHIIIDSKVSLVAYNRFVNEENEEDAQRYLKAHIDSVKMHVTQLSDKNYQSAVGIESPDFVLMFMPIESSFSQAIKADIELFNFAWERQIVIVSPSTLLATLRTIASLWKQERQTQNAMEIAKRGGLLYDKFVNFVEDLEKIGVNLNRSQGAYDNAMKKLSEGRGALTTSAEKLRELGAKANKTLSKDLLTEEQNED